MVRGGAWNGISWCVVVHEHVTSRQIRKYATVTGIPGRLDQSARSLAPKTYVLLLLPYVPNGRIGLATSHVAE